jgi:hypothetical protein
MILELHAHLRSQLQEEKIRVPIHAQLATYEDNNTALNTRKEMQLPAKPSLQTVQCSTS